jgi:hypothetical protein
MCYKTVSLEERPELISEIINLADTIWPKFMIEGSISNKYYEKSLEFFRKYNLFLMNGKEVVAFISTAPLHYDKGLEELPDEGWDWALEKAISDCSAGIKPNILSAVDFFINKKYSGKGVSYLVLNEMFNLAKDKGLDKLILPVRPNLKHNYPLIPMENYVEWKAENLFPFDNWLRVHIKTNSKIIKVCQRSMTIRGTVDEWKKWTNLTFPGSGLYIIPGALNPVSIDIEKNEGVYIEPNVWMIHEIKDNGVN